MMQQPWNPQLDVLGEYLREQRRLSDLSLRELASVTDLSNAYISQLERGLHQPSVRVLRSLASALNVSAATMLAHAGLTVKDESMETTPNTEAAIRADPRLSEDQKLARQGRRPLTGTDDLNLGFEAAFDIVEFRRLALLRPGLSRGHVDEIHDRTLDGLVGANPD